LTIVGFFSLAKNNISHNKITNKQATLIGRIIEMWVQSRVYNILSIVDEFLATPIWRAKQILYILCWYVNVRNAIPGRFYMHHKHMDRIKAIIFFRLQRRPRSRFFCLGVRLLPKWNIFSDVNVRTFDCWTFYKRLWTCVINMVNYPCGIIWLWDHYNN